jgi:hypothetical protein
MDHYANAFALVSERCFRMIHAGDGTGHAQHCPYIPEWRGRWQDGVPSKRVTVTAPISIPYSGSVKSESAQTFPG